MKELKCGDIIRYIGTEGGWLTHNQLYEVIEEYHYEDYWEDFNIVIKDDTGTSHYISEDYFNKYFIKF